MSAAYAVVGYKLLKNYIKNINILLKCKHAGF